ncbi:hypothetical protein CN200_32045 [Sinorhizobium meliloti]|uniref:hypothetical protein n=1 Tax=Rhizobium meliloti TaxID=382 RepID=UPI000FD2E936|nr:hypothetical protein [Sinorhizobium meliloti]MDX0531542.1 hypothetical protein [Sinorhizobium medicae]MDX0931492.1 hypothetical protein [Sinorhizobium medicae]RVI05091.1 hypothetical protein CN200_32045 [Sinorhizobium meliloti]RVN84773.1 hypothetical protein CN107_20840 [Sinorhizobium meliloti]RVO11720.1 hypothetical protein CN103_12865 [Sinorhizobium meliloti]
MLSQERLDGIAVQVSHLFDRRLDAINFFRTVRPAAWAMHAPIHGASYLDELKAIVTAADHGGWLQEVIERLIAKFPAARTELANILAETKSVNDAGFVSLMNGGSGAATAITHPVGPLHKLGRAEKIALIRSLTQKAVPAHFAPDLWPVFADATDMIGAQDLVLQANNLRCAADPQFEPRAIALVHLPTHGGDVGAYWSTAFSKAATRGARMVAALLLAAPAPLQEANENLFRHTLQTLREA